MFTRIHRSWLVATAVCLSVAVAGGIALASTSDRGLVNAKVLRFQIVGYVADDLDVGTTGRSPGDTFFVQHRLWNLAQTTRLGRYDTACTIEKDYGSGETMTSLNRCTATLLLDDGTIELANRVYRTEAEKTLPYAVIGGTGAYMNVVGQATVIFGEDSDTLKVELVPSFQQP